MKTQPRFVSIVGSLLLASSFLTACAPKSSGGTGTKGGTQGSGSDATYNFQQPTISAITGSSPGAAAIGDTMHVFGSNFIDPQHGTLFLSFDGTFTDQNGNSTRQGGVNEKIPLTYVGAGEATFILGPDNVLGPSGTIGQFSGAFQVASTLSAPAANGEVGDQSISAPQNTNVTIGPSIFLDELRSVDAASSGSPCSGVTPSTTGSQNIRIGLHYVGMDDASDSDPVFYTVTYDASQLTVAYLANQTYTTWPDWGPSTPNAQAVVATGTGSFTAQTTTGNGTTFDPQSPTQQVVTVNPAVTFNESQQTNVKLAGLATPAVTAGSTPILLTIRAQHQSGATINRVVNWTANGAISFGQATPQVLTAWEAATIDDHIGIVKGSIPNGSNMSYNESSSDTKQKTISMSWNINNSLQLSASANLGIGNNTFVNFGISASASQTWSQTFGTDVSTSDSITTGEGSNTSVQVNPGMFGAFYIQWGDLTSSVHVIMSDACGNSQDVGVATLTSHVGYLAAETSTQNPPPCPIDANDCHAAGPVSN
jgi:hypothetical protein